MQFQTEIVWLAKQLEKQKVSSEPSMWNAIRQAEFSRSAAIVQKKRHVSITGEQQLVFDVTQLAESISELQTVTTFTSTKYVHPALQWMDITYYPPSSLDELPAAQAVTLFVDNRLPIWSRALFKGNQVANVVALEDIPAVSRFEQVTLHTPATFSFIHLLDDVLVKEGAVYVRPTQQLFPELPKQYSAQLAMASDVRAMQVIMDEAAASMLNTYWLQNNPPFPQWMPVLLKEIRELLIIQMNVKSAQMALEKLKVWGNRDKRIS